MFNEPKIKLFMALYFQHVASQITSNLLSINTKHLLVSLNQSGIKMRGKESTPTVINPELHLLLRSPLGSGTGPPPGRTGSVARFHTAVLRSPRWHRRKFPLCSNEANIMCQASGCKAHVGKYLKTD